MCPPSFWGNLYLAFAPRKTSVKTTEHWNVSLAPLQDHVSGDPQGELESTYLMALTGHFVWRGSLLNTQPGTDFSKRAVSALVGSSKHHLCVWTDNSTVNWSAWHLVAYSLTRWQCTWVGPVMCWMALCGIFLAKGMRLMGNNSTCLCIPYGCSWVLQCADSSH